MPKVLLSGRIHEAGMAVLRRAEGVSVVEMPDGRAETFLRMLPDADALLIRTAALPAEAVAGARRLKVVSRHGVGYDNVPVEALTASRVPLALAVGANAESVAEHVFFLVLAIAKQGPANDRHVRAGRFAVREQPSGFDLAGRTLLLVGFGRVGRAVARIARAFRMRVVAFDPAVGAAEIEAAGAEKADDWRRVLPDADVVSLHVPRLPETENMIGQAEIRLMKPDAILVNTARGGLVDEAALAAALAEGRLAGAGIDTFAEEPPDAGSPLLASDRVLLSPHNAGLTRDAAARLSVFAAENVLAGLDGRLDPAVVVNPSVLGQ